MFSLYSPERISARKAVANPSEKPGRCKALRQAPGLLNDIRPGWNALLGTNTTAYFAAA
jgi:hypothetical protein